MSDHAEDALQYALNQHSIRGPKPLRADNVLIASGAIVAGPWKYHTWDFAEKDDYGLTVDKLREAKRRLLANDGADTELDRARRAAYHANIDQQIVAALTANPQPIVMEAGHIDAAVLNMLTKKDEVMSTVKKAKVEKFNTIGVRYINSGALSAITTYKVRIGAKVHLGQELVVDHVEGPRVVVVARIDKTPQALSFSTYIDKKAVAL